MIEMELNDIHIVAIYIHMAAILKTLESLFREFLQFIFDVNLIPFTAGKGCHYGQGHN